MNNAFQVSVIIPIYNAERFLYTAVASAVDIECVSEIILVEDGSPDNSLTICQELVKANSRIKLVRHEGGVNKGAGASRNLGIQHVTNAYFAFLDADDYYLPWRFDEARLAFAKNPNIGFSYGAAQYEKDYEQKTGNLKSLKPPRKRSNSLFAWLLMQRYGFFHTNAVTIRAEKFKTLDHYFNPDLRLHQDSELWLRMAYYLEGASEPGDRPIAIIRQHELNRITHKNDRTMFRFWSTVRKAFQHEKLPIRQRLLIKSYCWYTKDYPFPNWINQPLRFLIKINIKFLRILA